MTKYEIGDKIVFKTGIVAAYHQNLIPKTALTQEQIDFLEKANPRECAYPSASLKFYGKVTGIKEGREYYSKITEILEKKDTNEPYMKVSEPYRLVQFLLSNGKELRVLETDKNLRKANLLERLVKKF